MTPYITVAAKHCSRKYFARKRNLVSISVHAWYSPLLKEQPSAEEFLLESRYSREPETKSSWWCARNEISKEGKPGRLPTTQEKGCDNIVRRSSLYYSRVYQ